MDDILKWTYFGCETRAITWHVIFSTWNDMSKNSSRENHVMVLFTWNLREIHVSRADSSLATAFTTVQFCLFWEYMYLRTPCYYWSDSNESLHGYPNYWITNTIYCAGYVCMEAYNLPILTKDSCFPAFHSIPIGCNRSCTCNCQRERHPRPPLPEINPRH